MFVKLNNLFPLYSKQMYYISLAVIIVLASVHIGEAKKKKS